MTAIAGPPTNHDDILMNILVENKTLVGFLFSVFGFLSRKTDFYMIRDESDTDSVGFPPGIAEELVLRVLRKCNSGNVFTTVPENCHELIDDKECIPPPVAEEVEIEATEEVTLGNKPDNQPETCSTSSIETLKITDCVSKSNETLKKEYFNSASSRINEPDYPDPEMIPSYLIESQTHPETYNGAKRSKYSWSQTIRELDVTVLLPEEVKSSKQLKINLTSDTMNIQFLSSQKEWTTLIKDKFTNKTKSAETIWTMSEGKVRIQLEKHSEMWWNSLLESEEKIDTTKIDCSRPLDELPEHHIAKVRELQWNQLQKLAGKPTSDELKKQEILKKAWNMPGSPFANTPYDPDIFH